MTDARAVGGTGVAASGQFLFGDEANLTAKTPAYLLLNLHTSYELTLNLQLFGLIENAFNASYYTFGTFSPTSSARLSRFLALLIRAATVRRRRSPAPSASV